MNASGHKSGKFASLWLIALLLLPSAAHADLVLEQREGDTNLTEIVTVKLHDHKMRMDEPSQYFSVIVDLQTRDSISLFTNIKKYLKRSGAEIRQQMEAAKKTGASDAGGPADPPVDTGKTETVQGWPAHIFHWSGGPGQNQTLWVATNFPNYALIRDELRKLDQFNASGPHPNAQPELSELPGMVLKTVNDLDGHLSTNTLVGVKIEPVDPSVFEMPTNYLKWEPLRAKP